MTLDTAIWIEDKGFRFRIPTLEAALANKYGAMLTFGRDPLKQAQDGVDFGRMVRHADAHGQPPINLELLAELGAKVWPSGGAREIVELVAQVRAGGVPRVAER